MRHLHDELMGQCAVRFDEGFYQLGLLTYVLSKIISKPRFWRQNKQNAYWVQTRALMRQSEGEAKLGQAEKALRTLEAIFERIENAEGQDPRFVKGLLMKAKIKAASTFYAQGLSLGRASEMTGLDKREILSYAGQTTMNERIPQTMAVGARLKALRALFK